MSVSNCLESFRKASFSVKDATVFDADDELVEEMGAIAVEASGLGIKFGNVVTAAFWEDAGTGSGSVIAT